MFPSPKRVPPPEIKVYKSNTATINFDNLKFNDKSKTTLDDGESILFIVKSQLGNTVLSKTLVSDEGAETPIQFDLVPDDTINLHAPYVYDYSISLFTRGQEDFFTLQKGNFILMNPIGTILDIDNN